MTEKKPSKICRELTHGKILITELAVLIGRPQSTLSNMAKRFPEQFRLICLGALYDLQQLENKSE